MPTISLDDKTRLTLKVEKAEFATYAQFVTDDPVVEFTIWMTTDEGAAYVCQSWTLDILSAMELVSGITAAVGFAAQSKRVFLAGRKPMELTDALLVQAEG